MRWRRACPSAYAELLETQDRLERHFRDMQDIEFTVERGKLYLLQTRTGKRTAAAAVRIATDMVDEGLIDERDGRAARRAGAARSAAASGDRRRRARDAALHRTCPRVPARRAASPCSIPTSPSSARAAGDSVILVRDETTPEDFHGIVAARAVLTARGGMTSHAAVVARGMGKCAVVGCKDMHVDRRASPLHGRRHDRVRGRLDHARRRDRHASIAATCRRRRARSCR